MKITARQKDGGWQGIIRYKKGDQWKSKSKQGFEKKKDALAWAEMESVGIIEDIRDNIDGGDMTLNELMERYLEYVNLNFRKSSVKVTVETIAFLRKRASHLLNKPINKIRPIDFNLIFQQARQETGLSYYQRSVRVRTIFNFAIKELKALRDNPCNTVQDTSTDLRIKYISDDLYIEIIDSFDREDVKLFIKVLKNTGLRISEAFAITRDRILPDRIIVDRQWDGNTFTETKTSNSIREVPLPNSLYRELIALKVSDVNGRLFLFSREVLRRKFKKLNVSPHCFRHTYASNLVASGYNIKTVADILGDTLDTVIKTYVHSSPIEKEKIFAEINAI